MNSLRNVIGKGTSSAPPDPVVESPGDDGQADESETTNIAAATGEPSLFLAKWRQRRTPQRDAEGTQVPPGDNPAGKDIAEDSTSTVFEEEVVFVDSTTDDDSKECSQDAAASKPMVGPNDQDSVATEDGTEVSENQTPSDPDQGLTTNEEALSTEPRRGIRGFMSKLRPASTRRAVDQRDPNTPDNEGETSQTGNILESQEEALSNVQMEGRDPCEPQDNKLVENSGSGTSTPPPHRGVARFVPSFRIGKKRNEENSSNESPGLNQQEGCSGSYMGQNPMLNASEEIILVYDSADDAKDLAAVDKGEEKCEDTVETTQEEQPSRDIASNDTTSPNGRRRWLPRLRPNSTNNKQDSDTLGEDVLPNQVLSDAFAGDEEPAIAGLSNPDMTFEEEKEDDETEQQLQVGDHVFQWCSFVGIPGVFQHHGIVCGVAEDDDELNLQIADFSGLMHHSVGSGRRLFSRRNGEDVEEEENPYCSVLRLYNSTSSSKQGPRWRKVQYSCSSWTAHFRRSGTCTTAPPDSQEQVIARLNFLLANPEVLPPYHVFHANCECVAVWCKTGRWATLQGSSLLGYAAAGQAKFTATAAAVAASQQVAVTTPATGVMGMLGYTTTTSASMVAVNPMILPAIAGYGAVAVGGPFVLLLRSKKKWAETTDKLNDEFWDCAMSNPDIYGIPTMQETNLTDKEDQ